MKMDNTIESKESENWITEKLGIHIESMKNGLYKPKSEYSEDGIPCLRMYNINEGKIHWHNIKRMLLSNEELDEYLLIPGDILVNRVNSRELVGKSAIIPRNFEKCVYESKNIRLRLKQSLNGEYANYWLLYYANTYFNQNAQQTVGMASINQQQLSSIPIPIPPSVAMQINTVKEINARFSIVENTEKIIEQSLQQIEILRQSILKAAFEGKLVPQEAVSDVKN